MRYTVWSVSRAPSTLLEIRYLFPPNFGHASKGGNWQSCLVVDAAALYSRVPKSERRTMRPASSVSWRQR